MLTTRLLTATFLLLAFAAPALAKTQVVAGPMVGHIGPTSARLWMQLNTVEEVTVNIYDVRGREVGSFSGDVEGPSPFIFDGPVAGLEPERTYRLEILFDKKPSGVPDLTIRTPPAAGDPAAWTLAFGSCLNPDTHPQMPIFRAIEAQHPRAFLWLGNAGYLPYKEDGYPRTRKLAARFLNDFHYKVRTAPDLQSLLKSTANYAVWDDHDYGTDNAGKDWVYAKESWTAFCRYWPIPDYGTPEAPGVYHAFTVGDVDVFLLDVRTYRDRDNDPDRKTMLGTGQLDWLKKKLAASRATFKIIAAPTQFLTSDTSAETWGNFKPERDDFIAWLYKNKVSGVIFVSGDRHFGELSARKADEKDPTQYPLFELTSSPLAASVAAPEASQQGAAARVGPALNEPNFGTIDFGGPKGKRHATLRLRNAKGDTKLERIILGEELTGQ